MGLHQVSADGVDALIELLQKSGGHAKSILSDGSRNEMRSASEIGMVGVRLALALGTKSTI